MSVQVVHRPARTVRPVPQADARKVEAPPTLPDGQVGGNVAQAMLPVAGVLSSLTMMVMFRGTAMIGIGAVLLLVTMAGVFGMLLSQRGKAGRTRRQQRERYLDYLEELRDDLHAAERAATAQARLLHPPPAALFDIVRDPARRWERRRTDRDFLWVRAGSGTLPAAPLSIDDQGSSLNPTDPFMLAEAKALVRRFATAPGMPLVVPLDRVGNVSIVGAYDDALAVARILLIQAAALHAPDDVRLGLACPPDRMPGWEWAKWLPHTLDAELRDGPVAARRIAPDPRARATLIGGQLQEHAGYAAEMLRSGGPQATAATALLPRLLLVHDTHGHTAQDVPVPDQTLTAGQVGVTVLHLVADRLHEPGDVAIRITITGDGRLVVEDLRGEVVTAVDGDLDPLPVADAEGLARMLAPLRLSRESVQDGSGGAASADFAALIGVEDVADLPLSWLWKQRSDRDLLRVPIGVDATGEPVLLDLKESAQLGMGPHGLCVGATGSGKSELLRSLVLALLATHPPDVLSMVLVDYKGGATFAPFEHAPHVAGVITNLEDDASLVERVHTSLAGEVQRRQQALRDAGNVANIADYAALRARRPDMPPLPYLLVIIDEFGELLTAKPEFVELFLSIGRIGRSIGVHLLLSSQRIESGKLRGLDTYLSYRLGLRTFSEGESRTVLDTPDAYHLPPLPGFGYLKVDTTVYQRFKAAYVSGPYRAPDDEQTPVESPKPLAYPTYNTLGSSDGTIQPTMPTRSGAVTVLDKATAQLTDAADAVPQIWLPPLPAAVTLAEIGGGVTVGDRGLELRQPRTRVMRVPLGLIDDPARQCQGRWDLDLTTAGGHAAIIGGPQSGRTTLLRTVALSLALTHTPAEVAVYGVDLTGGALNPLTDLPHVGGIAGRTDSERVRRTLEHVRGMLEHREHVFRDRSIDSLDRMRTLHTAGRLPELPAADVVLLIDGYAQLAAEFEHLEPLVHALLQRGGGYGIHVVASMLRWHDVRIALQSTIGTRVELRLNDPTDSAIDRRLAEIIRPDQPGRALTTDKLYAHVALPRIDAVPDAHDLGEAITKAGRAATAVWTGPVAPPVRVLPGLLTAVDLTDLSADTAGVPIGVGETGTAAVTLDLLGRDSNLLVFGDGECGKTNLLALIAEQVVARYSDDELVFAVIDPRRGLEGLIPEDHLGGYAHNATLAERLAGAVAAQLAERQNGTAAQPWPHIVLLVDDYDVLTSAGGHPLSPLLPYVPAADDLKLHVVLARRVAGVSRGLYQPFVQAIRESGTTGVVMAGDRSEGKLLADVYARPLPPGRAQLIRRGRSPQLIQTAFRGDGQP